MNDDAYFVVQQYANNERKYEKYDDDDFYTVDDDGRRVMLESPEEAETASRSRNAKVPSRNVPKYDEEEHGNLVGSSIREFIAEDGLLEVRSFPRNI